MLRYVDISSLEQRLREAGDTVAIPEADSVRWALHGATPRLTCAPAMPEAVAASLRACDEAGAAVIPWGGGTQRRLGLPPERADVALLTPNLNRLLEYEPGDLTVTVESGMRFADLQMILAEKGQWLPLDPALQPEATVGGVVATNASGPRRRKDGGLRDLLIGTRVARPDGTLTRAGGRVVKNVTGYDLNKLHIGAMGTLGVLVEVTFKVAPRPETERSWFAIFPSAEMAGDTVVRLLRRPLAPSALDILNSRTARAIGLPAPDGRWVLVGRASGFKPAVDRHLREFDATAAECGAVLVSDLEGNAVAEAWAAYGEKCAEWRWADGLLTCRMALPPAATGDAAGRVSALGGQVAIWGHATGALFVSESMPHLGVARRVATLRGIAEGAGGQMVVENWAAPEGLETGSVDVWGKAAGPLALMQAIKREYDPHRTINPGRFVGGI